MSDQSTNDTPTHRVHILQMGLKEIERLVADIRVRRAVVVEKIARAKTNSKIAREAKVNKQLQRIFERLQVRCNSIDEDIGIVEEELNKYRALLWEISDGEVDVKKDGDEERKAD